MYKELRRSKEDRILAGVCSGIGLYTEVDPVLIRLIWAVGTFFSLGTGILIYIIAWIIIPEE
ncbi:Phage shock protein PspC (stress-responsive transcriptional regulator) [Methanolobus vulcani]|jgi:Putative stress-responsive transcriptional regulator|uniref:Phage shock protein PspC (Stress-responsive transcriptional regulator) n=1 Tax=Methanolobus vulcani TaxID=38026 RepID=A0A7Z7FDH6_9EURY|nr:PspC domain-containing protein [Methanolobus vulcani]SDF36408.1 Phage shock protein PspC (stress-responsive transcriptional regulator) [Methanolobus vulcani]